MGSSTQLDNANLTIVAKDYIVGETKVGDTSTGVSISVGTGAPSFAAAKGSVYIRLDGSSSSTRMYINSTGSTTWVNVTTSG